VRKDADVKEHDEGIASAIAEEGDLARSSFTAVTLELF